MAHCAGFDVSDKLTTICIVDADGSILRRDAAPSDPEALTKWLARHCSGGGPGVEQTVLDMTR